MAARTAASFENDVFISYAHIDNASLIEGHEGWVSLLHKVLEIRVAQFRGRQARIWRDPKLAGNDVFGAEITERLPRVALLVSVLSPRYLHSEWCTRELDEFRRAAEGSGGLRIGNKIRVFKVVKTPLPPDETPPPLLEEVLGYEFYVLDPVTERPHELAPWSGSEEQRGYYARIDDLAYDITQLLRALEDGDAVPAEPRGTVYLAETSYDLRDDRDALKRDLVRNGYRVLPDRPLPTVAAEVEAAVAEALAEAQLSVHPVGSRYGVVPDGTTESVVELQHRLARERGLSRLIWLPPGVVGEDERQGKFLEVLRSYQLVGSDADLLEVPLEELKTTVYSALQPPAPRPPKPPGEAPLIYLICDQRDLEDAALLEGHLFDRGYEVVLPAFEGDETAVRRDHIGYLCTSDAVLIYYRAADSLWLRKQHRELRKSRGYGRRRDFAAKAIWIAKPGADLRTRDARILEAPADGGFDPAGLKPFLDDLERFRAGSR